MLFLLTGQVQTGKTRWLQALARDMLERGVPVWGVVAPGVWRESRDADDSVGFVSARVLAGNPASARLEKTGIDNVLLPSGARVPFARRCDLAQAAGVFDAKSQSARANLVWSIDDAAIVQVNEHFSKIARLVRFEVGFTPAASARASTPVPSSARAGLLVIDEFGMLELARGEGLTEAVALVDAGAAPRCPHALVVVREQLYACARDRFTCAPWGGVSPLHADDEGRAVVFGAFGLEN